MDKLRSTYSKYKSQVFAPNARFVDSKHAAKFSRLSADQLQKMKVSKDYKNYNQANFYRQKFSNLSDIANKFELNQISEENYHKGVRQIMQEDFIKTGTNQPPASLGSNLQNSGIRQKNKSPLKQFFDAQQAKVAQKVNFSKLLGPDETPLRYGLRSVSRSKSPVVPPKNNEQLKFLEQQNRRLKQKLNSQKNNNQNDEQRLIQLRNRLRELDEENRRLKTEASKSERTEFYVQEEYDPYNLKVRQNDIVKIHNKNIYLSERMSQFGGLSEDFRQKKSGQIYYDNQSDHIRSQMAYKQSPIKRSNQYLDNQELLNASQSTIQTHFLNLENSQLYDEQRNQLCREKIAFFKKSMVLVKNPDFDIAFKRSDFNYQMDRLRLILYVNNKSQRQFNCSINYDYEYEDFEIQVKRKLTFVEPRSQGREQIQIHLKNSSDLGSIINAKVMIGDRVKKIIVPALFIDFDTDYKYQFEDISYLERNLSQPLTIKPMSQFSTIDKANGVLDLIRQYQEKYEVGKLYGKSKAGRGMVKLTWKRGNKLKIQTCEQWRTLMGYLLLNADETLNY